MSLPQYDYVIIGAGPAGMAAAVEARQHGLNVLVLDEQPAVGGQIYRNIEDLEEQRPDEFQKLGADYQEAFELAQRFRASRAEYRPGRSIWQIDPDLTLYHIGQDGGPSETCHAQRILIATGAMERPMPFPGWTLPGVLACTAADVLYKSSGLLPRGEIVLLGSGPLLLLIACRLLDAGVKIAAYLDTNPHLAPFQALPYLPKALRGHEYLRKGIAMLWQMFTSGAKVHLGITGLEAEGEGHLQKVRFHKGLLPGRSYQQISCFCIMVWFPTFRSPDSLVVSTLGTRSSATGNLSSINGVTPVLRMSLWLEIQVASVAQPIQY